MSVFRVHVNDKYLPTLLEGYLEIYFGQCNSSHFRWLLLLANESIETFPELQPFQQHLPKSVVKYFIRKQLLSQQNDHQVDEFNVLQLYDCEVNLALESMCINIHKINNLPAETINFRKNYC